MHKGNKGYPITHMDGNDGHRYSSHVDHHVRVVAWPVSRI